MFAINQVHETLYVYARQKSSFLLTQFNSQSIAMLENVTVSRSSPPEVRLCDLITVPLHPPPKAKSFDSVLSYTALQKLLFFIYHNSQSGVYQTNDNMTMQF